MTRGVAALLCLWALAGCGGSPSVPKPPESPAQIECERKAEDDPAVKELVVRSLGSQQEAYDLKYDLNRARQQATLRCLRLQGLAPPGGVESVRPPR